MKKLLLTVLLVIIMFISLSSVLSVNATNTEKKVNIEISKITNSGFATITGRVINRFGFGESGANVFIYIGEYPLHSTYYKTIFTNIRGYYKMILLTGEKGITLQIQAKIIAIWGDGDKSQWEELTVFPNNHYEIPDLVLSHWPINRQHLVNPLLFDFLQKLPVPKNILSL